MPAIWECVSTERVRNYPTDADDRQLRRGAITECLSVVGDHLLAGRDTPAHQISRWKRYSADRESGVRGQLLALYFSTSKFIGTKTCVGTLLVRHPNHRSERGANLEGDKNMKRRSFIATALAGLVAIPFIEKFLEAKAPSTPPILSDGFWFTPDEGVRCFAGGKEVVPNEDGYYWLTFERNPIVFDRKLSEVEAGQIYDHARDAYGINIVNGT